MDEYDSDTTLCSEDLILDPTSVLLDIGEPELILITPQNIENLWNTAKNKIIELNNILFLNFDYTLFIYLQKWKKIYNTCIKLLINKN